MCGATLDTLHGLYGHDQSLKTILDGLNTRLARARELYGPGLPLPMVVSGLCDQLDELRRLYGILKRCLPASLIAKKSD
jgi:hypothetical protein